MARSDLQPGAVRIRLVQRDAAGTVTVLGQKFAASWAGINGQRGFQSGSYERRLNEEGTFSLSFPNAAGEDAVLHRERFRILTDSRYRAGDEWIEIYRVSVGSVVGDLLFVGTPTKANVSAQSVELSGFDAMWLLRKQRETGAGWHSLAPRDAFESYTRAWVPTLVEPFANGTAFARSGAQQTTADGRWRYLLSDTHATEWPGKLRMHADPANTANHSAFIRHTTGTPIGAAVDSLRTLRMETTIRMGAILPRSFYLIWDDPDVAVRLYVGCDLTTVPHTWSCNAEQHVGHAQGSLRKNLVPGDLVHLAIEVRGRWAYNYVNGELVAIRSVPTVTRTLHPFVRADFAASSNQHIFVDEVIVRETRPFLMRGAEKGDYTLPGAPTAGGLLVTYFTDIDLRIFNDSAFAMEQRRLTQAPTRQESVFGRRQELNVHHGANGWQPAGTNGDWWSARHTGSIYLDLANYDYRFRLNVDDATRLWIGKTTHADPIFDRWYTTFANLFEFTPWLRSVLGNKSGWYPIIWETVENAGGEPANFHYERSDGAGALQEVFDNPGFSGTYASPVASRLRLSPLGIFDEHVRHESFHEVLTKLCESWGLQTTLEPRSLESGEFPGRLIPRKRVGRDTDVILEYPDEAMNVRVELNAEDSVDSLTVDAAGLADPGGAAQLNVERLNIPELGAHLMVHQEYESLSDISIPELLQQRVDSLLTLRSSVWENVDAQPLGRRQLADTFPITGALAEFAWEPGDGVRLRLPQVGVDDVAAQMPRQIMGMQRVIRPDGLGPLTASFRQRPRGFREALARLQRAIYSERRNYQGQLVTLTGTTAANNASAQDPYSRVPLPQGGQFRVVSAYITVMVKEDASPWTLHVNGVNGATIFSPGRYDVTGMVQARSAANVMYQGYGHLVSQGAASTGFWELIFEMTILT